MSLFEAGTTIIDKKSTNFQGVKAKYLVGMNDADDDEDFIVFFVLNTEKAVTSTPGCDKKRNSYILPPNTHFKNQAFLSIVLRDRLYKLKEVINSKEIELVDSLPKTLLKEILKCIDKNELSIKGRKILFGK